MKKLASLILMILFFVVYRSEGQTVLLNYDRATEPKYNKGPNRDKFVQGLMKIGFVTPPEYGDAKLIYGSSVNLGIGLRKKFKVSGLYSLGWQFEYEYTDFKFKKNASELSPAGTPIKTKRFDVSALALGFFNRFNFDPDRGNHMGTFFDIGINIIYAYSMNEVYKYETGYGEAVTKVGDLDYVNSIQSDFVARFGYSKLSMYGKYRVTDYFESDSHRSEVPRVVVGIELGLY